METYSHTQTSKNWGYTVFLITLTAVVAFVELLFTLTGTYVIEAWLVGIFILVMSYASPHASTITVNDSAITWGYRYLFYFRWSQKMPLPDIASAEAINDASAVTRRGISTSFYSLKYKATGYRFGRGSDFIKILKKDGAVFLLGTDEPQLLLHAIQAHLGTEVSDPLPERVPSAAPKQALQMLGILICAVLLMSIATIWWIRTQTSTIPTTTGLPTTSY